MRQSRRQSLNMLDSRTIGVNVSWSSLKTFCTSLVGDLNTTTGIIHYFVCTWQWFRLSPPSHPSSLSFFFLPCFLPVCSVMKQRRFNFGWWPGLSMRLSFACKRGFSVTPWMETLELCLALDFLLSEEVCLSLPLFVWCLPNCSLFPYATHSVQ